MERIELPLPMERFRLGPFKADGPIKASEVVNEYLKGCSVFAGHVRISPAGDDWIAEVTIFEEEEEHASR